MQHLDTLRVPCSKRSFATHMQGGIVALLLAFLLSGVASARDITVGPGGPSAGYDTDSVYAALAMAFEGDRVLVAPGRYVQNWPADRRFDLRAGVTLEAADPSSPRPTLVSMENSTYMIERDLLPGAFAPPTVIRGINFERGMNGAGEFWAQHPLLLEDVDLNRTFIRTNADITMRRVAIRNQGKVMGMEVNYGKVHLESVMVNSGDLMGVYLRVPKSVEVVNCEFRGNSTFGGLFIEGHANDLRTERIVAKIRDCTFADNISPLSIQGNITATVSGCQFSNNYWGTYIAGVHEVVFEDCIAIDNPRYAFMVAEGSVTFRNIRIEGSAVGVHAMRSYQNPTNVWIESSQISGAGLCGVCLEEYLELESPPEPRSAHADAVSIYNTSITDSNAAVLINEPIALDIRHSVLLSSNTSQVGLLGLSVERPITVSNSILRGGRSIELATGSDLNLVTVSHCNISGGWPSGVGNFDADPEFTDLATLDLTLKSTSPCIDAGDPQRSLPSDAQGEPRPDAASGLPDVGLDEYYPAAMATLTPQPTPVTTFTPRPKPQILAAGYMDTRLQAGVPGTVKVWVITGPALEPDTHGGFSVTQGPHFLLGVPGVAPGLFAKELPITPGDPAKYLFDIIPNTPFGDYYFDQGRWPYLNVGE